MSSDLRSLRDIISSSVDNILNACESAGKIFPSLDEPVQLSEFTPEGIRNQPAVAQSIALICAAATQLIATVRPPPATLTVSAFGYTLPAALGVAEAGNVPEILREAGPKGMHVKEIAEKAGMDHHKLSRVLRYLATNHWFREVSPEVFANNMLSSLLDTGKEITKNFALTKHDNSPGMAALAGYGGDEAIKAASYLREALTDEKTKFSQEAKHSAVQKALGIDETLWEFYDRPENELRRKRFAIVMAGSNRLQPPESILYGFDWGSLPKGGIVVDVGGGLGQVSLEVSKAHPDLRVVLEDRPLIIEQAKQFWQENLPRSVTGCKVQFIGTDFFEAQPKLPGTPDVFLLRMITHDWADLYAIKILRRLRDAAGPNTKLILIDCVLDYACGSGENKPPPPLLGNLGGGNLLSYSVDLTVFGMLNAGERTALGFEEILSASGWQLQEIRKSPVSPMWWPSIISVPK
ncbi:O-methyltransferase [Fomitiporia mediterranea MF3/22]|uniref:O-methyltransferase n=1 Tax=Fomitiporia mediterranea (strain MF3/22) TaxID=694068 RepID=UPI00044075CC|nr:O-methyltransferase [Fomitiporia mediterranea MF3/22]EJD00206.1 O-methyltransferase [Fomitiporia mediterranea MF3/22]